MYTEHAHMCAAPLLHASSTPSRNAPKQKKHPNTRHDLLADARAGLVRTRLVQRVQPCRAQCACSDNAA